MISVPSLRQDAYYYPIRFFITARAARCAPCGRDHAAGFAGTREDGTVQKLYADLPDTITVVGCRAHARRKFDEAVNALTKSEQKESSAIIGQQYCGKLFAVEEKLAGLSPEERYLKRLELEKPILDALFAWAQAKTAAPKSALGKALYYLQEQWPHLIQYLKDGRLELSNNRAERSIKPFVMDRKKLSIRKHSQRSSGQRDNFQSD